MRTSRTITSSPLGLMMRSWGVKASTEQDLSVGMLHCSLNALHTPVCIGTACHWAHYSSRRHGQVIHTHTRPAERQVELHACSRLTIVPRMLASFGWLHLDVWSWRYDDVKSQSFMANPACKCLPHCRWHNVSSLAPNARIKGLVSMYSSRALQWYVT